MNIKKLIKIKIAHESIFHKDVVLVLAQSVILFMSSMCLYFLKGRHKNMRL